MFFLGQQRSSTGSAMGGVDVVQSDVHDTWWLAGCDRIKEFERNSSWNRLGCPACDQEFFKHQVSCLQKTRESSL